MTRTVELVDLEIRLLELPLRRPMVAAHGTTEVRQLLVVGLRTTDGVIGWGECAALPEPTYSSEFAEAAMLTVRDHLAPRLLAGPVDPDDVGATSTDIVGHPMAKAAVEMAVIDAHLRAADQPLASALGVAGATVAWGGTVGEATMDDLVEQVGVLAEAGAHRVKLKIRPGHDVPVVATLAATFPDLELHGDANGAYGPGQIRRVIHAIEAGLRVVEQPFAPTELDAAAELVAAETGAFVLADEAATSLEAIELLRRRAAADGVVVKPGRLGGLRAAVEVIDRLGDHDLRIAVGGMIESGLGRAALAPLAALAPVDVTGDLSPAGQWLEADPFTDLTITDDGRIAVPNGPGITAAPDPDLLDELTVVHTVVERA